MFLWRIHQIFCRMKSWDDVTAVIIKQEIACFCQAHVKSSPTWNHIYWCHICKVFFAVIITSQITCLRNYLSKFFNHMRRHYIDPTYKGCHINLAFIYLWCLWIVHINYLTCKSLQKCHQCKILFSVIITWANMRHHIYVFA